MAATLLSLSVAGAAFIMAREGVHTTPYLDPVGIPTVCAGSTRSVYLGKNATLAECEQRLQEDAGEAGKAIARCTSAKLTQGQYDALVSLSFNIGGGAYCLSTLVRKLNAGDCLGAASEFQRWNRAGGRVLPGLTKRRAAEAAIFKRDCT